jgi:hypothetical protein
MVTDSVHPVIDASTSLENLPPHSLVDISNPTYGHGYSGTARVRLTGYREQMTIPGFRLRPAGRAAANARYGESDDVAVKPYAGQLQIYDFHVYLII